MIFIGKTIAGVALMLAASSLAAQTLQLSLEEYAGQRMQVHGVVGASIAVIENGRLRDTINLGLESALTGVPISEESVFQVGSISKSVAAWVAMTLVRDGKLALDQPVNDYLRRWKIPQSNFDLEQVTLRQLLSHTAGLSLHGYAGFVESEALPSLEESLSGTARGAASVKLFRAPGDGFSYSGGGYSLIQLLVEETSGMTFSEYAELSVLAPLAMDDSSYTPENRLIKRRVEPHGYSRNPIAQRHFRAQAAASLHTTANDLAKFVVANIAPNGVLASDDVALMHSPIASAGFASIGLGFFIGDDGHLVGHAGANLGWRAEMQFNPNSGNGLVVLTNSDGAGPFLREIKCYWDAQLAQPLIASDCSEADRRLAASSALTGKIVTAIALIMTMFVVFLLWVLLSSRASLALPRSVPRLIGMLALVSASLFIVVFLYTPIGAYLVSGFWSIFATIHYAPHWVVGLAPWVIAALLMSSMIFFLKRTNRDLNYRVK